MAEAVVFDIAGELIMKLGSRVVQEIGLWWNVEGELAKLKSILSGIHAVLLDAEEQHSRNHQVRDWLGKLKDAVYDADDLLDDFSTEALHRQLMAGNKISEEVRIFFSSSNKLSYGLKMGHKVKAIRERLDEIAAERKFHLETRLEEKSYMGGGRETHSYVRGEDVIGRDEDKEEIVNILLNSEENNLVVPIVGIGGLGKTTLAQLVYNDDRVKIDFKLRMWVCISDPFDVKLIVRRIVTSGTGSGLGDLEMDQLQNMLREKINDKKYLLVLDDVWNEDRNKWLELERLLRGGCKGSRIIATTRSTKVAEAVGASSPYVLKGLSEMEAWGLFMRVALKHGEEPKNGGVVEIGKKIVRKCAGVPLAIKTIGSLLYFKDPESEWSLFENEEFSGLNQQGDDILPTLELSYDYLPSHLKNCFAYCKLFPKDSSIDVSELIYLWMAQGFIKPSNKNQCLEDIGMDHFKELLCRSFFQEVEEDEWGNIRYCKMHDLMHDLAILVGGKESILMQNSNDESVIDEKTRHVSFDSSWQIPSALLEQNKIRTFLKLPFDGSLIEAQCNSMILNSRKLRTLDFHNLNLVTVPNSIGKLKHLRYLNFSEKVELETLPNSITKLPNLQVFKLLRCSKLKRLPSKIRKLVSLRRLEIEGCCKLGYMPRGIGQLSSLQRLDRFIVDKRDGISWEPSAGLSELEGLNNLGGHLNIENLGYLKNGAGECRAANLKAKKHLHSLSLVWNRNRDEASAIADEDMSMELLEPHHNLKALNVWFYEGARFPSWLSSLTNLVHVKLLECTICKHLPPLDQLTCLQFLEINSAWGMEYIEENDVNWCNVAGGQREADNSVFPSLKKLVLSNCPNLKGWWRRRGDHDKERGLPWFPHLSELVVEDCPNLSTIPSFPFIEGKLEWHGISWMPVQQTITMRMKMSCSTSCSVLPFPLSKLKSLELSKIEDLECLPEEGLRNLTSLESLEINQCPKLITLSGQGLTCLRSLKIERCERLNSLSGVLQHLTALEKLEIQDCEELDLSDLDDLQFQGLQSLSRLSIWRLPKLESLPESLQYIVSLKELAIRECHNLKSPVSAAIQHLTALKDLIIVTCKELDLSDLQFQSLQSLSVLRIRGLPKLVFLPESLQHVVSLKTLAIWQCPNLKSFPVGMDRLTSLRELDIQDCPHLSKTCQKDTGTDWPKIAHIPRIIVDRIVIQQR